MHIVIQTFRTVGVSVVSFRQEYEMRGEFRFAIERPNAFQDVTEIHVEGFVIYDNFFSLKTRSGGRKTVDEYICLPRGLERQL